MSFFASLMQMASPARDSTPSKKVASLLHMSLAVSAAAAVGCALILRHTSRAVKYEQHQRNKKRLRSTSIGWTRLLVNKGDLEGAHDTIINGVFCFDDDDASLKESSTGCRLPDIQELIRVYELHAGQHRRLHSVPVQMDHCGEVTWVPRKVHYVNHFHSEELSAEEDDGGYSTSSSLLCATLRDRLDEIINTPLTTKAKDAPWWEVHRIAVKNSTRGVLLIRIHHAIGDGVSLMEMFSDAVTDASGNKIDMSSLFNPARYQQKSRPPSIARSVKKILMVPLIGLDMLRSVWKVFSLTVVGCDTKCAYQDEARQLPYQNNRFTVYFPSHSVKLIKQIKEKLSQQLKTNITINDVEFALFAGAIRRYCLHRGEDASSMSIRAITPFAVPELSCPHTFNATLLRNHWTFLCNDLPVASSTSLGRIVASHKTWQLVKETTIVPIAFFMRRLMTHLPVSFQGKALFEMGKRISTVFTNVPGPQCEVYLCGRKVSSIHCLFPNIPQQVGILSVNGTLHMALVMATHVDKNQTKALLPKFFMEELLDAAACVGISKEEVEQNVELLVAGNV